MTTGYLIAPISPLTRSSPAAASVGQIRAGINDTRPFTEWPVSGTVAVPEKSEITALAVRKAVAVVRIRERSAQQPSLRDIRLRTPERSDSEEIFDAIQALYLSGNTPRDRQIAERIAALHRTAISEGERSDTKSR